jgi:hypothetical protein
MKFDLKQLEKHSNPEPKNRPPKPKPSMRKMFFKKRHISDVKIASMLEVSAQAIGDWLNNRKDWPKKREVQIENLMKEITEWEKEHGRIFNSEDDQ